MSIYNGFATRKQETTYLKCLYYMFVILQSRAASSINGTNFDESKFEQKFEKLYDKISELDRHKYLHPRFSMCFTELADAYGLEAKHFQLRKHTRNSKCRKDNRSCSQFVDNLSSNMNTNIDNITEQYEYEVAGHGVIQNFRKIAQDEAYSMPISDKRINMMKSSPDHLKCEDSFHSVKNKKNKYSHFDKKIESSKEIILEDDQEFKEVPKRQRNQSCHYHKCQTIHNDQRATINSPAPINSPIDQKFQSNKKQKKRKNKAIRIKEQHINKENNDHYHRNEVKIQVNNSKDAAIANIDNFKEKETAVIFKDQNELRNQICALQPIKHSAKIYDSISTHHDSINFFDDNCEVNENTPPNQFTYQ